MVVTALSCFIWSWNDFMFALALAHNQAMTIPIAITHSHIFLTMPFDDVEL